MLFLVRAFALKKPNLLCVARCNHASKIPRRCFKSRFPFGHRKVPDPSIETFLFAMFACGITYCFIDPRSIMPEIIMPLYEFAKKEYKFLAANIGFERPNEQVNSKL